MQQQIRSPVIPLLFLALATPLFAQGESQPWQQYADPAEAGFSAEALAAARDQAIKIDSAALFVLHRGHVLLAWGEVDRLYRCHSVRKSFLSALYGIQSDKGQIDLDASLEDLGIDDREPLTDDEKQARVIDLLRSRSGIYHPAAKETRDMWRNRLPRGTHAPGEQFLYNNWDFNALASIYNQETGGDVFGDFKRDIADPTGMQDLDLDACYYQLEPGKSQHAAYAFRMSARDMARFGQLFLQEGKWSGEQVLPREWVAESTSGHSELSSTRGYGYMWWVYPARKEGEGKVSADYDKFSANGTGGQLILVIPALEMVFVHRGDTDNDRRVSGGPIWRLIDQILSARIGDAIDEPELGPIRVEELGQPGPLPIVRQRVPTDPRSFDAYLGEYRMSQGPRFMVFRYQDRLFARAGPEEDEMVPMGKDRFFLRADDLEIEFLRDDAGQVTKAKAWQDGKEVAVERLR